MIDLLIIVIFRKYTHFISALKTVILMCGDFPVLFLS